MKRLHRIVTLTTTLVALPVCADSTGTFIFDLDIAQHRSEFEYAGVTADTSIARVSLSWYEPVSRNVELGVFIGGSELTQKDRALTAGVEAQGYHAGVGARGTLLSTESLHLTWDVRYLYDRVEADDTDQSLTIAWYTPQAKLGVAVPLGRVTVFAGAAYSAVDGEERARGLINATTEFKDTTRTGGYGGIELRVANNGFVGIAANGGDQRGVTLYFARRYSAPVF